MSKSIKHQFNSAVTIKLRELNLWLRALLFVCSIDKDERPHYFTFVARIKELSRQSGNTWVCKYLKECTRLVMVWASQGIDYRKTVVLSIGMPVGLKGGLPLIIPTALRRKMESGDMKVMKVCLTILNLYRIWPCPPVLKLETITAPFSGVADTLPIREIKEVFKHINLTSRKAYKVEGRNITTAGPNFKISSLSAPFDAFAFSYYPRLLESFETICRITDNLSYFNNLEEECARIQKWLG